MLKSLIQIRKEKKVSQLEMARFLSITPATINRYEKGLIQKIPIDLLVRYADYLGYEIRLLKK
jgi:transcriptional regulator with XRE-family HTH domain